MLEAFLFWAEGWGMWFLGGIIFGLTYGGLSLQKHYRQKLFQKRKEELFARTEHTLAELKNQTSLSFLAEQKLRLRSFQTWKSNIERSIQNEKNSIKKVEKVSEKSQTQIKEYHAQFITLQHHLKQKHQQLLHTQQDIGQLIQNCSTMLEHKSQTCKNQLLKQTVEDTLNVWQLKNSCAPLSKELAVQQSRRLITLAIDRYNGVAHLERLQNLFFIEDSAVFAQLADFDSNFYQLFMEKTGCTLQMTGDDRACLVRSDDPLSREKGRRVLQAMIDQRILQISRLNSFCARIDAGLRQEVEEAGVLAVKILGLKFLHPEILQLVGRLKFRLSYSQNQWKHAIEVGFLAGLLADELNLSQAAAKRAGLLHDIGKAMTHDHEGSHAVLGAAVARRCGEDEMIANAIGAHHYDEPMQSPLALIVAAADALSGARPGARREAVAQYFERLKQIEEIAYAQPAVEHVDIMQGGREVRLKVNDVEDEALYPLVNTVSSQIEQQVTFAGQIRVTVICDSRATAIAR